MLLEYLVIYRTRKMVPITGHELIPCIFFVCTLRDWNFQKQKRKEEEDEEGDT